jgi:hypothetical protein
MREVTFQILEGVDKGRVFRNLPIPVTIGREEGNSLRLNDERVSRFHAKVQCDGGDIILTDLDSTNGTRVNGMPVQIRRLKPGDQIIVGRTVLLFGSAAEIHARCAELQAATQPTFVPFDQTLSAMVPQDVLTSPGEVTEPRYEPPEWRPSDNNLPLLPQRLTPAQAARLAEILDYLHRGLASACENIIAEENDVQVRIPFVEWQKIQAVEMLLARYSRAISEPTSLLE